MPRYFITGTDTGCGKTQVTCELLRTAQGQQRKTIALKPVASGSGDDDDLRRLQQAQPNIAVNLCPWHLSLPVSPHLAARHDNQLLSAKTIANFCTHPQWDDYDMVYIEGAGGLMVPLNEQETWLDFLQLSQIPVILVVGMRLGCLNHALLTASVLRAEHIPCAGWIANILDPEMLLLEENIQTLIQKLPWPLLRRVEYQI